MVWLLSGESRLPAGVPSARMMWKGLARLAEWTPVSFACASGANLAADEIHNPNTC